MNNKEIIAFAIERLEEVLGKLKDVKGVRGTEELVGNLESKYSTSFSVIYNDSFELTYIKSKGEMEFKTTYSNQTITPEFMNEMMLINQVQMVVASNLKVIAKALETAE